MTEIEIIAQIIGIFAMVANCLSYQQKKDTTLFAFQLVGSSLFGINYFLLGALSGAILNVVAAIRALIFIRKDKFNAKHPAWLAAFITLYLVCYALIFTVFEKEPTPLNLVLEFLPVLAMIVANISFRYADAKMVRRFGIFCSPLWLTYNIANVAIGAIICETLNILSIIIGMFRHDFQKPNKDQKKTTNKGVREC